MSLFLDGSESFYAVRKCAEMSLMHLLYLVVMWSRACPFSVLKTLHETASRRGLHTQLTKIPSQKNIQRSESPVRDFHKLLTCGASGSHWGTCRKRATNAVSSRFNSSNNEWMFKSFLANFKTYHMFELFLALAAIVELCYIFCLVWQWIYSNLGWETWWKLT